MCVATSIGVAKVSGAGHSVLHFRRSIAVATITSCNRKKLRYRRLARNRKLVRKRCHSSSSFRADERRNHQMDGRASNRNKMFRNRKLALHRKLVHSTRVQRLRNNRCRKHSCDGGTICAAGPSLGCSKLVRSRKLVRRWFRNHKRVHKPCHKTIRSRRRATSRGQRRLRWKHFRRATQQPKQQVLEYDAS